MNNQLKKILKHAAPMLRTYGADTIEFDEDHVHPIAIATMVDGTVIRCMGIPNTTGTEDKHVAQNMLKRIRAAHTLGDALTSYRGGK